MLLAKMRFFNTKCPLFNRAIDESLCDNCEYLIHCNRENNFVLCGYFTPSEEESRDALLKNARIIKGE